MNKYICNICGYIYLPEEGMDDQSIDPGTDFNDIDAEAFGCPLCGSEKSEFSLMEE